MFVFEVTVFVFKLQLSFNKKVIFIQNVYEKRPLFDKKTYNWKTNAVIFKN